MFSEEIIQAQCLIRYEPMPINSIPDQGIENKHALNKRSERAIQDNAHHTMNTSDASVEEKWGPRRGSTEVEGSHLGSPTAYELEAQRRSDVPHSSCHHVPPPFYPPHLSLSLSISLFLSRLGSWTLKVLCALASVVGL